MLKSFFKQTTLFSNSSPEYETLPRVQCHNVRLHGKPFCVETADRPDRNAKTEHGPPDRSVVAVVCGDPPTSSPRDAPHSSASDRRIPSEPWRPVGNPIDYSSDDSVPAIGTSRPTESETSAPSSDGSQLQNNPFARKLRNTTVLRQKSAAPLADLRWFLPESAAATSSDLSSDDVTESGVITPYNIIFPFFTRRSNNY